MNKYLNVIFSKAVGIAVAWVVVMGLHEFKGMDVVQYMPVIIYVAAIIHLIFKNCEYASENCRTRKSYLKAISKALFAFIIIIIFDISIALILMKVKNISFLNALVAKQLFIYL